MHNDKLTIIELANQQFDYSGLDNIKQCLDRSWFSQWPHVIDYKYNSRGFRDQEWPQDLESAVWCLGDSFTVGLGSPWLHTWPQVLGQHSQRRVINIAMDGASNEWIARTACDAYDLAQPRNIVMMWSYLHRREHPDTNRSAVSRRLHSVRSTMFQDFENFNSCRKLVQTHCAGSNLIELAVPKFATTFDNTAWKKIRDPSWPRLLPSTLSEFLDLPTEITTELRTLHDIDIDQLLEFYTLQQQYPQTLAGVIRVDSLDQARDGHHFDLITSEWVAMQVQKVLNL
jgi:hypothetical protein